MPDLLLPIVGAFHHPPAKGLLLALPQGQALVLRPEPENPHDPNAIKVVLVSSTYPADLADLLEPLIIGYGVDLEGFKSEPEWHLGYIPRTEAANLSLSGDVDGKFVLQGTKPCVRFEIG